MPIFGVDLFVKVGFPDSSVCKESACNAGDLGLIPGLERSPGEGKGNPTPVFWPGEFHGLYSSWSRKESDMTKRLSLKLKLKNLFVKVGIQALKSDSPGTDLGSPTY